MYFCLYGWISMRNISFRYCLSTKNMLSDTDAARDVIILALCLGIYETPLNQRKAKAEKQNKHTYTHTNISREISCWGSQIGAKFFAVGRSINLRVNDVFHPTVPTANANRNQFTNS